MLDVFRTPLLVAGCATYHPQPISPEKTAAAFDARSLADEDLRAFLETNHVAGPARGDAWNLKQLTLVAFYYQPALAEARAQWAGGPGRENHRGRTPESVRVRDAGIRHQIPGTLSPWMVPVTLDVPIETAGKRGKRIAEAEHLAEAARWNFVGAAWQVRSQVRAALLNLYAARETESLLARQETAQSNVVRLLEGQLAAGAVSSLKSRRPASRWTPRGWRGRTPPANPPGARATGQCARPAAARAGRREIFLCRPGSISRGS